MYRRKRSLVRTTVIFRSQTSVEASCLQRTEELFGNTLAVVASHHAWLTLVIFCAHFQQLQMPEVPEVPEVPSVWQAEFTLIHNY